MSFYALRQTHYVSHIGPDCKFLPEPGALRHHSRHYSLSTSGFGTGEEISICVNLPFGSLQASSFHLLYRIGPRAEKHDRGKFAVNVDVVSIVIVSTPRRINARPDYFGGFDFVLSSRCTASALRISGLPCAHALSMIMRLKRHFAPSRVSSQS